MASENFRKGLEAALVPVLEGFYETRRNFWSAQCHDQLFVLVRAVCEYVDGLMVIAKPAPVDLDARPTMESLAERVATLEAVVGLESDPPIRWPVDKKVGGQESFRVVLDK